MTPEQLAAIKERAEKATPGPWYWRGNTDTDDPRLVGGPGRHTVLVVMRRERQTSDRETKGFERYLRECDVSYVDADGKTAYRPYTDEEIADQVETEWLHDPWGGPAYDLRLAFRDMDTNIMGYARDMAVYEVCPEATTRDDERVYRADVVGVRHPDAVFMEHAREDVPALLAEIDRLTAELARYAERLDLDAWERLEARLAAAETVCTIYGWCGNAEDSLKDKAATQAWMDWHNTYGSPKPSPEWRQRIAELAARRDAIRAKTLAAIRGEHSGTGAG